MGDSDWLLWAVLIVASAPLYVLLGIVLYGGWENYKELLQALREEGVFGEPRWPWELWSGGFELWSEHTRDVLRLIFYIVCCVALVFGEYLFIRWQWPRPSPWDHLHHTP